MALPKHTPYQNGKGGVRIGLKPINTKNWLEIDDKFNNDNNLIRSAHDVSLGGIITAVAKMCIKGKKGINIKKPKYLINEIEYFFAEDQGRYIIEISKKDQKKVLDILDKNAVHYDELGTINENMLFLSQKSKVTIDELKSSNTNWLIEYMSK